LAQTSTVASPADQVAAIVDLRLVVDLPLRGADLCTEVFVNRRFVLGLELASI
jgi:hypothetical protein